MKKTIIIALALIFNFQFSVFNSLRAQGFDWHRFSIAADASLQTGYNFLMYNSGLFEGHPYRSASLSLNYRLGQHWEVGLYANVTGSEAMSSGGQDIGNGQSIQWMFIEDRYALGWGVTAQLHLIPYKMRHEIGFDMALRLGFDAGEAEADNFWGGLRWTADLSRHVALTMSCDIGSFYFGRTYSKIMGLDTSVGSRFALGIQVEL